MNGLISFAFSKGGQGPLCLPDVLRSMAAVRPNHTVVSVVCTSGHFLCLSCFCFSNTDLFVYFWICAFSLLFNAGNCGPSRETQVKILISWPGQHRSFCLRLFMGIMCMVVCEMNPGSWRGFSPNTCHILAGKQRTACCSRRSDALLAYVRWHIQSSEWFHDGRWNDKLGMNGVLANSV